MSDDSVYDAFVKTASDSVSNVPRTLFTLKLCGGPDDGRMAIPAGGTCSYRPVGSNQIHTYCMTTGRYLGARESFIQIPVNDVAPTPELMEKIRNARERLGITESNVVDLGITDADGKPAKRV